MKIAIIGYSGSGKSTLARKLANYYKTPILFLDTINFLPNWVERDKEEGCHIVETFLENESWVIDGNYQCFLQKKRLEEADQIIFLDFPRRICFYRALKRYFKNRRKTRADMAAGCIEKMDFEFMRWILHDGRTKERKQHFQMIQQSFSQKTIVLKTPKEVHLFLKKTICSA